MLLTHTCTHTPCRLGGLSLRALGGRLHSLPAWLEPVLVLVLLTHCCSPKPGESPEGGLKHRMVGRPALQVLLLLVQACKPNQFSCYRIFLFAEHKILNLQEKEKALKGYAGSK